MNKAEAINNFWNKFLPAYDQNTVPDDAKLPYITYTVSTDNINHPIPLNASIWYEEPTWENIEAKTKEIADYIGYGHVSERIDNGFMWIVKGSIFAQRMTDPNNKNIRRMYINIIAEFLTA